MKISLYLLVSLFACISFANDLSGHWLGQGRQFILGSNSEVLIDLELSFTESSLNITECWETASQPKDAECLESQFELEGRETLLSNGNKVGDIFPGKIIIFQSNTQVSEQMLFINRKDGLYYRYTYSNLDGESQWREGILKRGSP